MADYKLLGKDHTYQDLVAKVTGRAKYAEDFRAEGMLFAKLLLSPMPHGKVVSIDASRALRMEGVVGMVTADDLAVKPDFPGEAPLTMEPLYEGEPILAVAAVDEHTAAAAIEAIRLQMEPMPFAIDPLASLAPGSSNAREQGNVFKGRNEIVTIKWTPEQFAAAQRGDFPTGEATDDWSYGDLDAAFKASDLVIEERLVHQSLTHHPMEPRTAMAYWQNGKLFIHAGTQSTARTRPVIAQQLGLQPDDVVLVSEYCGGGFGSKISGSAIFQVPALLAKKLNRPVMLRVTRAEETYFGRARPGYQGWVKIGFAKTGKVKAIDLYLLQENGPYGRQGDYTTSGSTASLMYQPEAMRFRGIPVITNTPPKAAQRGPGGSQIVGLMEPLIDKAAWQLNIDRVAIRHMNAPAADATFGQNAATLTSSFAKEAIEQGAEKFGWNQKLALSRKKTGTKVTGIGVGFSPYTGGSSGYDGLLVIKADGKMYIHQGIGNLGTHSVMDTGRTAAEVLDFPWERCEVVWGDTSRFLPWSSSQSGSQTTHAHTRANHAVGMYARQLLQELAAQTMGGSPASYEVGRGRVYPRGNPGGGIDFAEAARRAVKLGGKFDGHEVPEDINDVTKTSVRGLAGTGLVAAAKDNYQHEGSTYSFAVGFALVELDVETGDVQVKEYLASTDCGTVINPRGLGAQLHGGGVQGMGIARSQRWVYDPRWGVALGKRFYSARPPGILDVPREMQWHAVNLPDPQNPVGAKGIGEPAVGAGQAAVLSAIADAMGGECLCRSPLTADMILASLEGRRQPYTLWEQHV